MISPLKFTKDHNSIKPTDEVTVLYLCTLSDYVVYLYRFPQNISEGFRVIE